MEAQAKTQVPKQEEDQRKAASDNWDSYQANKDAGHLDWLEHAEKCNRFYLGGGQQWDENDRKCLEAEGRPALEVNMVLTTVNSILGEQINQQAEMTFKPARKGTEELASTLSQLIKHILSDQNYQWSETQVFSDGCIEDRGFFDIRMDFNRDLYGEVSIKVKDPRSIVLDKGAKEYDPATWKEVIETRKMTLDDIENTYGKKHRDALSNKVAGGERQFGPDSIQIGGTSADNYDYTDTVGSLFGDTFGEDDMVPSQAGDVSTLRSVRVIDRQHRKMGHQRFWVDNQTGDMAPIPDNMDDGRVNHIAQVADMSVIRRYVPRVRWTISVDDYLIHDDWSIYDDFTIVPFFPYFRRGKPQGVVSNLLSPQEQLNKAESQELHIVNTSANSGWIVEAGSIINMSTDELEKRGAETGLVLITAPGREKPEKIQHNKIPTGIDRVGVKAANNIKAISGVYDALLGSESPEVSGVAMDRKLNRGLVQLQVPFNNLNKTRHLVAKRILKLIQTFYTETRTYYIANYQSTDHDFDEVTINQDMSDGSTLNDVTVGEYDVVVASVPTRDTFQDVQFAHAMSMRDAGVFIPDDVVIESSNMLHKEEIAKRVREIQGMGDMTPEQQELLAQQQLLMLREQAARVAELEGKAAEFNSRAQLNMAKAGAEATEIEMETQKLMKEFEEHMREMQLEWNKHITELQNKLALAGIHASTNLETTRYTTAAKRVSDEFKARFDYLTKRNQSNKAGGK